MRRRCNKIIRSTYSIGAPSDVHRPHARMNREGRRSPFPVVSFGVISLTKNHPEHLVVSIRLALDEFDYVE